MQLHELRSEIAKLATRAVLNGEGNHSCHENLATGPKYQQIEVGDNYGAFRTNRRFEYIRQINHTRARVLDIGSNLGVTSRYFAHLGASEVVGLEYDPYFVAVANLVNTAEGVENVRFRQGDATNPEVISRLGVFNIVYSLSSFNYSRHVLQEIAEQTLDYFVVETHRALPGCYRQHVSEIGQYFPCNKVLGFTDHGRNSSDHRLFIVFSRYQSNLDQFTAYDDHFKKISGCLDLEKTQFSYLKDFFDVHDPGNCLWKAGKDPEKGITGVMYWEKLLEGYVHWLDGGMWKANPYYRYLLACYDNGYPGGDVLNTRADHEGILRRRFETFDRAKDGEPEYPIKLKVQEKSRGTGTHHIQNYGMFKIADADGVTPSFDGVHRCFMYKYTGWETIPAEITFIP
jgi:SAM-dependent methyltransferase